MKGRFMPYPDPRTLPRKLKKKLYGKKKNRTSLALCLLYEQAKLRPIIQDMFSTERSLNIWLEGVLTEKDHDHIVNYTWPIMGRKNKDNESNT